MILPDFSYHRVDHLAEALDLLQRHGSDAKILAGGTDLLLHLKRGNIWGRSCPGRLISLRDISELSSLTNVDGHIRIGAGVTHRKVELSARVREKFTALYDAVSGLASVQIRNIATLAGNVCNAAPCADTAAPLMALGAAAKLVSLKSERTVALKDFFRGPGAVDLNPDEILEELRLPDPPDCCASAYMRASRREAMDITIVGAAVYIRSTPDLKKIRDARIALNTAAPKPIRAAEAENMLIGADISQQLFEEAGRAAAEHAMPRTSFRSTAEYRREMVRVFVRRALIKAFARIRTESGVSLTFIRR